MALISLCMIVKDEAEVLPRALQNLGAFADELIIVDTGSTDDTVAIAEAHGAKVLHYDWQYPGHKGEARNVGVDAATGEWIVVLDADEIIRQPSDLREWLESLADRVTAANVLFENYAEDGRVSLRWYQQRIWRNGTYRYIHREHEMPVPVNGTDMAEVGCNIVFEHRPPSIREKPKIKPMLDRLIADVEERPGDAHSLYFLHRQWLHDEKWQEAINVGERFLAIEGGHNRIECFGNMATACWHLERTSEAVVWLHKALAYEPQRRYWWVRIAELQVAMGQWNTAMAYLRGGYEVWQVHQWQFEPGVEIGLAAELTQRCQSEIVERTRINEGRNDK